MLQLYSALTVYWSNGNLINISEWFKDDLFLEIWRACVKWRCLNDIILLSSIIHLFKPSKSCPFQTIVCKSAAQQKNNSINSWWIKTSNLNCRMQMSSQLFTWTVKNNKRWILVNVDLQIIVLNIELISNTFDMLDCQNLS